MTVNHSIEHDAQRLHDVLGSLPRVVVAFSGGVDSSVVAAAAHRAAPQTAVAITADSPSVPRWQIQLARRVAGEIGIQHRLVQTREGEREQYRRNDSRRCFFCKQTLYGSLEQWARHDPGVTVVSGTNADDLGDYRPGIEAGHEAGVRTPLADLGIGKQRVRGLARYFGLSNADLPASPCLASRIAYGVEVTPRRLRRIEQAEDWLRQQGFVELRVRLHPGEVARIEVGKAEVPRLVEMNRDEAVRRTLMNYGFTEVTIDPEGFRSGNLNRALVSIDEVGWESGNPRRAAPGTSEEVG